MINNEIKLFKYLKTVNYDFPAKWFYFSLKELYAKNVMTHYSSLSFIKYKIKKIRKYDTFI